MNKWNDSIYEKKLFFLQVNAGITRGGAAMIASNVFKELQVQGYNSKIATCKAFPDKNILQIPRKTFHHAKNSWEKFFFSLCKKTHSLTGKIKGAGTLTNALYNIAKPSCLLKNLRGVENFENYPGTKHFFENLSPFPDIIHCHNLHGEYFDLRTLSSISQKVPVLVTLHDEWMFTGHCACTFGCNKWKNGCGNCPNLSTYVALKKDTSAYNLQQKKEIYEQSKLHVITPSKWLMNRAKKSALGPAIVSSHVINNGINLSIFKPGNKVTARKKMNLPTDSHIVLFIAFNAKTNPFKDYITLEKAFMKIAEQNDSAKKTILLCIGEQSTPIKKNNCEIRFLEYVQDRQKTATYYQAAELFVHATKNENFPTTILEAFACGLPVIGTNVGGIPEQIDEPKTSLSPTGLLCEKGDHIELAEKISFLLERPELRKTMGKNARKKAEEKYNLKDQTQKYVSLYENLLRLRHNP